MVLATCGLILAACSSSDGSTVRGANDDSTAQMAQNGGSASTSRNGGSASTSQNGGSASSTGARATTRSQGQSSDFFASMEQAATSAAQASFRTTYLDRASSSVITYAQVGSWISVSSGTTTYYGSTANGTVCDSSTGTPVCQVAPAPTGVLGLVSPSQLFNAIQAAAASPSMVKHSKKPHGVQCLSYSLMGQPTTYCMNTQGILTSIITPIGTFQLTSYSTQVTGSDVSAPA